MGRGGAGRGLSGGGGGVDEVLALYQNCCGDQALKRAHAELLNVYS